MKSPFNVYAQTTVTVGTGTSTGSNNPISSCYGYSYTQQIYTASEIATGGGASSMAITKIRFYFSSGASTNSSNWTVYLGNTTKSSFASTSDWVAATSMTAVFSGTVTYSSAGSWMEIPLSTNFFWDGTSNLVIAVDENEPDYYCSNSWRYTSNTNMAIYYRSDITNPNPASPPSGTRTALRPNAQFIFENVCTGTPTAGASSASSTLLCLGSATTLSLAGSTVGAGISYQWQSSPTGASYTNISGATSASYVANPSSPTFYQCVITCSGSASSATSTPVFVSFTNNVSSVTSAARCGTGTVSLSAMTSSPGASLKWYSSSSGGTALGSGSPFTTPTVSTTTNYYVAAETNATGIGQIGTGTSFTSSTGYPTAFGNYWYQDWQQMVYTAAELKAAGIGPGDITALAMNISGLPDPGSVSGYNIRIGSTTASTLSGFTTTGLTTVYGPGAITPVSGWNTITFSTPYSWDGTSNIIIDIRGDGAYGSANATTQISTTSGNTCVWAWTGTSSPGTFFTSSPTPTATTSRPNIRFTGNLVCSSPRVLVSATVNTPPAFGITGTQTICNNSVATFSVTSPLVNYDTYTWAPVTGLFTDTTCTVAYTTGTSASKVYYKRTASGTAKYTCMANNSTTLCASTDTVLITNLPSSVTAIATPNSICASGSTSIALNPSGGYGNAGFVWQQSTDNSTFTDVTPAAGALNYTTPTLTSTKFYRVVMKSSAGSTCLNSTSDTGLVYNPTINTSTGASRCGPGSVTLSATATDGTVNWFNVASGATSIGSGNSFVTPSLTSTTTYYAEVRATPDATYNVGTGTATLSGTGLSPFSQYYESARTQYLITASDLSALGVTAGKFSTMAFNITSKSSTFSYKGYTVKLANTTATTLTGFVAPSFTTVYGPTAYTSTSGSNVFPLSGGFIWDGSSNLLVEICFSNATGAYDGWSSDDAVAGTTKTYTATYGTYDDNAYFCSGGTGTNVSSLILPNMVFTRVGCISSRTPVVATINTVPSPTISPATGPIQICAGNTTTFTAGGGGNYQWKDASGILIGETGSTFTTGNTGTYRVVVITPSTGCKDSSVFVGVNVNPAPTVSILPSGTRFICADSAQKYTSVVTGSGLTYQWFNDGTLITGATRDSFSASTAGVYTLRVYLGTCSDTSNEATLIINPLPSASFTKTGSTGAICLGSTLELTALSTPAGFSYQWMLNGLDIPGATSQIYNAPTGGIYTVRIKDGNNCRKVSDTMSIINTPMGVPNLLPKDVRFCEGTEIMLYSNAGPYARLFSWTKDGIATSDSSANITTGVEGIYDVTVEDVYGCVLTSPQVSITVDPLPVKPIITQTGPVLSTTIPYTTYQWYRNGKMIAGATKQKYTIMFDGYYHVEVTNNVNCFNSSDSVMIKSLSLQTLSGNDIDIKVYPNPTQNQVTIEAPLPVNLSVKDITGKQVLMVKDAQIVDMSLFADGVYIFTLTDSDGIILKMDKVMKRTN